MSFAFPSLFTGRAKTTPQTKKPSPDRTTARVAIIGGDMLTIKPQLKVCRGAGESAEGFISHEQLLSTPDADRRFRFSPRRLQEDGPQPKLCSDRAGLETGA